MICQSPIPSLVTIWRLSVKVGDLVKGRAKGSEILWMVLIAHKDDSSIYVQSLKTGYKMNAGKKAFEVVNEER